MYYFCIISNWCLGLACIKSVILKIRNSPSSSKLNYDHSLPVTWPIAPCVFIFCQLIKEGRIKTLNRIQKETAHIYLEALPIHEGG